MAKKKHKKPKVAPPSPDGGGDGGEDRDIAETRASLAPLVKLGVTHHRLASIAGAHPEDMRGFLAGRVSLTWELRRRLREAIPDLLSPREYGPQG